jgi:hypothetical protein
VAPCLASLRISKEPECARRAAKGNVGEKTQGCHAAPCGHWKKQISF